MNFLAFALFFLVVALFPDGRFVPRWTYWFVIAFLVESVIFNFFSNVSFLANSWLNALGNVVWVGSIASIVIAQIYRYRRISTPLQRQQTKWVVYGFVLNLLTLLGVLTLELLFPPLAQPGSLFSLVFGPDANLFLLLIPLSIGIAILRYRLYDIDIIINRTLVYGTLTATLAMIYAGLVIGLQSLVRLFTGQVSQSPFVIVASTLAIAALFQPLRRRLQAIIDRRFYRQKYNAARTLAAFSATLRNEVDLATKWTWISCVNTYWLWCRRRCSRRRSRSGCVCPPTGQLPHFRPASLPLKKQRYVRRSRGMAYEHFHRLM